MRQMLLRTMLAVALSTAGLLTLATACDSASGDANAGEDALEGAADAQGAGQDAGAIGADTVATEDVATSPDTTSSEDVVASTDVAAPDDVAITPDVPPDVATGAPGHTDDQQGVLHHPGKTDPLANCVACHGAALTGGDGPSCYSCHDNSDHTAIRHGVHHKSGAPSSCTTCHGPNNSGGLGPACSVCH